MKANPAAKGQLISPRSFSAPRSANHHNHVTTVINPIATLSHKDKLLLAQAFKKTPSKQAISAVPRFNPQDYLFDLEDDETNIIVENNVIKAASMFLLSLSYLIFLILISFLIF